jgi:hypothetical protein
MDADGSGTGLPWVEAIASAFEPYSFAAFHRELLPELASRHASLISDDLNGAAALAFRVDGPAPTATRSIGTHGVAKATCPSSLSTPNRAISHCTTATSCTPHHRPLP